MIHYPNCQHCNEQILISQTEGFLFRGHIIVFKCHRCNKDNKLSFKRIINCISIKEFYNEDED